MLRQGPTKRLSVGKPNNSQGAFVPLLPLPPPHPLSAAANRLEYMYINKSTSLRNEEPDDGRRQHLKLNQQQRLQSGEVEVEVGEGRRRGRGECALWLEQLFYRANKAAAMPTEIMLQ